MTRGGKRIGAGRKAYPLEEKRVQVMVTIDRVTREKLNNIADARGVPVGRLLDEMMASYEEK